MKDDIPGSYKRTWWIRKREYLYFKMIQIKLLQMAEPILFYLSKLVFIYFIIFNEYLIITYILSLITIR